MRPTVGYVISVGRDSGIDFRGRGLMHFVFESTQLSLSAAERCLSPLQTRYLPDNANNMDVAVYARVLSSKNVLSICGVNKYFPDYVADQCPKPFALT